MTAISFDNSVRPFDSGVTSGSSRSVWTGRVLSTLAVMFLTMDTGMKLFELQPAIEATVKLGYSASTVFWLGLLELCLLVAYVVPRTSRASLILWTGYLGGAVATHVRVGSPLFSHTLFAVYVALLLWGGLLLRDPRTRLLLRSLVA